VRCLGKRQGKSILPLSLLEFAIILPDGPRQRLMGDWQAFRQAGIGLGVTRHCRGEVRRIEPHSDDHGESRTCPRIREIALRFCIVNIYFIFINAIVEVLGDNRTLFPLRCCQPYFGETNIPVSFNRPQSRFIPRTTMHAAIPTFTELHQPAASAFIDVRGRSVSSWHGMPTASAKNKHFLN
jgi:hypothetical protein